MTASMNKFSDNFWESLEKNGISILIERMRGAKQTCERFKHAYESRALLEEEYGKTLLQITQKQKTSSTENGSSKIAMDTMQAQFQSVAESHLHLSNLLRENIAVPLSKLLNKQRILRKELQTSIQKSYSNRQIQVHFVRRAHKRHNLEIEKANLLVQQQVSEKDKIATFKAASVTIDKLKKVYDEALNDLSSMVQDWNTEWVHTCESFEKLEQERLEFFKSNLSNFANLMIGCHEGEIQACEKINADAEKINVVQDLVEFVNKNKSSQVIPTPLEYIKLHAYHEANQDKGDLKFTHNTIRDTIDNEDHSESEDRVQVQFNRKRSSVSSIMSDVKEPPLVEISRKPVESPVVTQAPVMMVGVMEVYPSDEDEDDDEFEYVTETESESEEAEVESLIVKSASKADANPEPQDNNESDESEQEDEGHIAPAVSASPVVERPRSTTPLQSHRSGTPPQRAKPTTPQDEKVDRLMSAYHQEVQKDKNIQPQPSMLLSKNNGFNTRRRVSFVETTPISQDLYDQSTVNSTRNTASPSGMLNRSSSCNSEVEEESYPRSSSEEAAFELDDMLRELDSKRIIREDESVRYRPQHDIKPTASISSPSLLQKQQQRRSIIPSSQYFTNQSRRSSYIESPSYSRQSSSGTVKSNHSYVDVYDPFNSLSSKETGSSTVSSSRNTNSSIRTKLSNTPPSAQSIHDRMLKNNEEITPASSTTGSIRSVEAPASYRSSKFIQDYYSVGPSTPSPDPTAPDRVAGFIDFAYALYDYEEQDEGEITFKEGDLLGVISKSEEDDEQGWWEASLLNPRTRKTIKTGLVPSNFLETVSK